MKVRELVELLRDVDQELPVYANREPIRGLVEKYSRTTRLPEGSHKNNRKIQNDSAVYLSTRDEDDKEADE